MALDQSVASWAPYQHDPTKAFVGGQWVDNTNPATQPGHGTVADRYGYYADVGGKPFYKTYAELAAEGLGAPRMIGTGDGNAENPYSSQLQGNEQMLAKYPLYQEKGGMSDLMGILSVIAAAYGIPAGLDFLTGAGAAAGGAGAGAGALGDGMAFGGESALQGSSYLGAGAGAGSQIAQVVQALQQVPGGQAIAQALVGSLTGSGGGAGGSTPGGFNIGSLLPLLGIGSGLSTLFGGNDAVDPNMINALWQAGQNTYTAGLDPQNALRDRTQQRVVDASRAGTSARGIGMSPVAAGPENDAVRNFNIDWDAGRLARQVQGTQAFTGAGNTAANAGVANNAQAFLQKQTGLNNLTTGASQLFPTGPAAAANPIGDWLNSLFKWSSPDAGGVSYNPSSSYDSAGNFVPYYTGIGAGGDPAYG